MTDEKNDYAAQLADPQVSGKQYVERMLKDDAFRSDYFARTHAGHTSGEGRAAHDRHVRAIGLVQSVLEGKAATERPPTQAEAQAKAKEDGTSDIQKLMADPEFKKAYMDKNDRQHAWAVDRIAGMYQKLNP